MKKLNLKVCGREKNSAGTGSPIKKLVPGAILLMLVAAALLAAAPGRAGEYDSFTPVFQKGFTLTSWWNNDYQQPVSNETIRTMKQDGVEYVALLVTWYQNTTSSPVIYRHPDKTPTDAAVMQAISDIHANGMKVMLKPHVDVMDGSSRVDIRMLNEANWEKWFANYTAFINHYATLAVDNGADIFCAGTELKKTSGRASNWTAVIEGVRARYSGPITYASIFDEYSFISWWDKVDYIGVDAYFPLTSKNDPTLAELKAAWVVRNASLANLSKFWNKPLIFTEIGYQSINGTNRHPWWSTGATDLQEQADCYRAAFETFWNEPWFYGVYGWDWYYNQTNDHDSFGVYGKPAELVLREFYLDSCAGEDGNWTMFEELVGGNPCYGGGIGQVALTQEAAFNGTCSLKVWANANLTSKSNHVLAQKKLYNEGRNGTWRYETYAYIPPAMNMTGQTGPEMSVQNTREISPGTFRTAIAGIQYSANPYYKYAEWNLWNETSPGVAGWQKFAEAELESGKWYSIILVADYDANRYVSFSVSGNGLNVSLDLSASKIAQEVKFSEPAFWLTLESENLWSNCGPAGNFTYAVLYDSTSISQALPNSAPEITWHFPENHTLDGRESRLLLFNHTSTDPDGDPLTYSWSLNSIVQSSAQSWGFNPNQSQCGPNTVRLDVFDSQLASDYESWSVNVLLRGDVKGVLGEGAIDIFDMSAVGLKFGTSEGEAGWNANMDVNSDGVVDIFDIGTVGMNFGRSC